MFFSPISAFEMSQSRLRKTVLRGHLSTLKSPRASIKKAKLLINLYIRRKRKTTNDDPPHVQKDTKISLKTLQFIKSR